jgi:penicillin-binding protein 1A
VTKRTLLRLGLVILAAGAVFSATVVALTIPGGMLTKLGSGKPASYSFTTLDQRSFVFASTGERIAMLRAAENREPIALADVPKHVVDAIIAVEDKGFYVHDGIDARGLLRAFSVNLGAGDAVQGGSTITQQLVKQRVIDNRDKTIERKVQEIVLARRIETEYTKDEILASYLNTVYFGAGAYGIEAAAETYYGKSARDLDMAEASMLAGLIRSPGAYNPYNHPEAATRRRSTVLGLMQEAGMVTAEDVAYIKTLPIPSGGPHEVTPPPKDYFLEEVKQQLLDENNAEFAALGATYDERYAALFKGGLRIYTTIDPNAQALAVAARDSIVEGGVYDTGVQATQLVPATDEAGQPVVDGNGNPQMVEVPVFDAEGNPVNVKATAALASVEPGTGAIRAMVGGPGFEQYQFNIATQIPPKNNGSSYKPFVLATLMDQGYSPGDLVEGTSPCTFDNGRQPDYVAANAEPDSGGWKTITEQTVGSVNCAYLRLGQIAGLENVRATALRLGLTPPDYDRDGEVDPVALSMPLGTQAGSVLEMAGAYAAFANDGVFNKPYYVDRIEDAAGRVIYEHPHQPQQAISADSARLVASILEQGVQRGTGKAARLESGQPAAGKTGTTNDYDNAWFCGFTPYLATAVWFGGMGQDVSIYLPDGRKNFGGNFPAEIWHNYMSPWHEGKEIAGFAAAPSRPGGEYLMVPGGKDLSGTPPVTTTPFPPPEDGGGGPPVSFPMTLPTLPVQQPPGRGDRTTTTGGSGTTSPTFITIPQPDNDR